MKSKDKSRIKEIQNALFTSTKPSQDECLHWNIFGSKGKIYEDYKYWYVMVYSSRVPKKSLSFMQPWQGDLVFRLDRLPTLEEAEIVRKVVGLKKKKVLSQEHRQKLVEGGRKMRLSHGSTEGFSVH